MLCKNKFFFLLINLWKHDGLTQQELSEKTGKDKGNMTRMISGLEKRNLVVRIPNHADGRSKLIYLTNKGKVCQKALIPIAQKTLGEAQWQIPEKDVKLYKSVLKQIVKNLKA